MKKISEKTFFQPGKNFVDPALFFSYFQEQVPNREEIIESTRKGSYRWYPVLDLFTGKEKLIPAQMIFLSENFDDEDSIRREQTSSGAAFGHKSSKLAIQNGLLELVERDAAISSYLMRREVPLINKFSGHIKDLLDYLKRYRLENYILDVTDDLNVPSVISVTLDRTGIGDAVSVGSKASLSYDSAIRGAILESIQCRNTSRINKRANRQTPTQTSSQNIHTMGDRFEYWSGIDRLRDLDFWVDSGRFVNYESLPKRVGTIDEILTNLNSKNYNVFVADISLPEIERKGFETKKVIIPELHALYLDERAKVLYSVHHGAIKDNPTLKPHPLT